MKVTDNSTYRLMQTNLDKITNDLLKLRNEGATGLKLNKPSDDPGAIRPVLTTRSQLQQNNRYLETMGQAGDKMAATDGHLAHVENILVRVKEIAINSVNSALSDADRATLADEIAELKNELLDAANAVVDGKYIFGGYREDTVPFTKNDHYNPDLYDINDLSTWPYQYQGDYNPTQLEITPGELLKTNLTGIELFMGISNTKAAAGYTQPYQGAPVVSGPISLGTPGEDITLTPQGGTAVTISGADLTADAAGIHQYNYAGKVASLFSTSGAPLTGTANAAIVDFPTTATDPFLTGFTAADTYNLTITSGGVAVPIDFPAGAFDNTLAGMVAALEAGATNVTSGVSGTLANDVNYDISSGSLVLTGPADGSDIELSETLSGTTAGIVSGGTQTIYGTLSLATNSTTNVTLAGSSTPPSTTTGLDSLGLSAREINGATNIDLFTVLTRTEEAIRAGNVDDIDGAGGSIQSQIDNLDVAANQNRRLRSQLGARANRVETAMLHQEDAQIDLKQILSRYQDADILQVFNDITQKETAFQAALNVTARVSKISILDYF